MNSQCPRLWSRAARFAGTSLGSDASSGRRQQIYITRAQSGLQGAENITLHDIHSGILGLKQKIRTLTRNSRWSLDIFPIKMLDDGFTFLCGLHPKGKSSYLLKSISVLDSNKSHGILQPVEELKMVMATRGLTHH